MNLHNLKTINIFFLFFNELTFMTKISKILFSICCFRKNNNRYKYQHMNIKFYKYVSCVTVALFYFRKKYRIFQKVVNFKWFYSRIWLVIQLKTLKLCQHLLLHIIMSIQFPKINVKKVMLENKMVRKV